MTERTSNCPNCGAPVSFQWSSSVQTVCQYCKSILVRTDVDLRKVGEVADLPPDSSPIQIMTEGQYGTHSFVVGGRIIYEYEQGAWNEWHFVMNDGTDGWLSDAQDEYVVTFRSTVLDLPAEKDAKKTESADMMAEMTASRRAEDAIRKWLDDLKKSARISTNPDLFPRRGDS